MHIAFLAPAVAVALLTVTGCAGQGEAPSAKRLAALTSNGVHVDYTPLASPREAVAEGDLIVRGTVTDVVDGITDKYPDPLSTEREAGAYATYVLAVDEVLSGDAAKLRDRRVYVTVNKSRTTEIADLARANSKPRVVAVLDDISAWTPTPDATGGSAGGNAAVLRVHRRTLAPGRERRRDDRAPGRAARVVRRLERPADRGRLRRHDPRREGLSTSRDPPRAGPAIAQSVGVTRRARDRLR